MSRPPAAAASGDGASGADGDSVRTRRAPFRALRHRNFRLLFCGQVLSVIGSWTHNTAVAWLIVERSASPTRLGLVVALQFTPLLVLGAWAGAIADRVPKRTLLFFANSGAALVAAATATAVAAGQRSVPVLGLFSFLLGCAQAFEVPARQSFTAELVPGEDLASAVGLNGATMSFSRLAGSALAGVLLVVVGAPACLYLNAISFLAVLAALVMMRPAELLRRPGRPATRKGQVRAGLRYAAAHADVRFPLAAMAVIGTLALNQQVTTPLLARLTFHAEAGLFAAFGAVGGLGALCGALTAAGRRTVSESLIGKVALGFGLFTLGAAFSPAAWLAMPLLAGASFFGSQYISSTSARLQTVTDDAFRGRVLALNSILFLGSTPVGGLVISGVSEATNPRIGVAVGGVAATGVGLVALLLRRHATSTVALGLVQKRPRPEGAG